MNFSLSLPKQKKSQSENRDSFPVINIPADDLFHERQFKGYFTGLNVEVFDEESIKALYKNGCFGTGSRTKTCPRICFDEIRIRSITPQQLNQKLKWKEEFGNQNPNTVMVKLLPQEDTTTTSQNENITIDEPSLIEDPFPIEEVLALLLEEAFFLHSSLKCLKIVDLDDTREFTTDELLNFFCNLNSRFIERFVAYQYYRGKNWVIKSGLKFGGDFRKCILFNYIIDAYLINDFFFAVLYDKGPEFTHASYVVLVSDNEVEQNCLDVQSNYRVSDTTGKSIIILKVTRPDGLNYTDRCECFRRLNEFKVTEIIPKRFQAKQLNMQNQ